MSAAHEILDQRLAKGEIDETEYRRLSAALSERTSTVSSPTEPPPSAQNSGSPPLSGSKTSAPKSSSSWTQYAVGGVIGLILVYWWIGRNPVNIGNVSADGGSITLKASNSSSKDVDTLIWIVQEEIEKCNKIVNIKGNHTHTIRFYCPSLKSGKFTVINMPASKNSAKARISDRIS